ncbi:unnamed protein product, partial [Tetraodon nigroviridis]
LLGEIAYQLDKRILCYIFQGHRRLYGFTLLNIPDKIIEVRPETVELPKSSIPVEISIFSVVLFSENDNRAVNLTSINTCSFSLFLLQVSTHPLTGKVDEGYRFHLNQRYISLMEDLKQLGYKATLHPTLSEFIVNSYGILSQKPGNGCIWREAYNDPDLLRQWITTAVPPYLEKEVHIFLNCLCYMAGKDEKPLLIW